jgi:hypothetical protein
MDVFICRFFSEEKAKRYVSGSCFERLYIKMVEGLHPYHDGKTRTSWEVWQRAAT